jgi:vitamin B12 transporter
MRSPSPITGNKCCFRYWTRRTVSILISLRYVIKIGVLCLTYSLVNTMPVILAQSDTTHISDTTEFDEVQITGRRNQVVMTELSRVVSVIRQDEIEQAGIQSVTDLLEFVANVDVRQRGYYGVQADVSIRGSSFDHVMILVNGVNLSDPQSGHLSLDLPLDPENIERIEVLEGTASRSLGPGAFMGAINIVTRTGKPQRISISEVAGQHAFRKDHIDAGFHTGNLQHFVSASKLSSNGYTHNTDFLVYNAYYRAMMEKGTALVNVQTGYQTKEFGAGGFYSAKFPDQYEDNNTWFASVKASTGKMIKMNGQIYWRRKKDHFLLIRDNPRFYENFHLTRVYGSQLNLGYRTERTALTAGVDIRYEQILSNNIGEDLIHPVPVKGTDSAYYTKAYSRVNYACFLEYYFEISRLSITTGLMTDWNTAFHHAPFFFPGIDAGFRVSSGFTIFASINRALHLPTFTDLFYKDPMNQGSSVLATSKMMSYEAGTKFRNNIVSIRLAAFYNSGNDIIDWLWSYQNSKFTPVNLQQYISKGITSSVSVNIPGTVGFSKILSLIKINYLFLSINKSIPDSVSKYYNLKHKLSLMFVQQPYKKVSLTWNLSFQERYGEAMAYNHQTNTYFSIPYHPFWLFDGVINWDIGNIKLFAALSNILNTKYIDAGSAIQQGRWFKAGITVNLNIQENRRSLNGK